MNNDDFTVLVSGTVHMSEHVYCVAITLESTEQRICIKFFIKLDHFSMETIWMIQKAFGDDAMSAVQIKV